MSCLCRICWTGLNCAPENSLEEQSFMPSVGTDCLQSQGTSRHENIWKHSPLSRARRTEAHLLEVRRDTREIEKQPVELRYVVFYTTLRCVAKESTRSAVVTPGAFFLLFYSFSSHCTLNMRLSALCSSSMRISIMSKSLRISMLQIMDVMDHIGSIHNPIYSKLIY